MVFSASHKRVLSASLATWPLTVTLPLMFSKPKRGLASATGVAGCVAATGSAGGGTTASSFLQLRNARNAASRISSGITHFHQPPDVAVAAVAEPA
ncbi:hypothetical protein D3C86_2044810 [compost metagenome]